MHDSTNYIVVEMDYSHRDFRSIVRSLAKSGFSFYLIHKLSLERTEMSIGNVIQFPIDDRECHGTLNKSRLDEELIVFIKQNHRSNGGCINHYVISE